MNKQQITETTLEGHLVHITYYNNENHFMIARFRENISQSTISILGYFPNPSLGEDLRIDGAWQNHPQYGPQLRMESYEILLPETLEGIRKYLLSAHIKGIGPKMVSRIIKQFGTHTLDIIEKTPQKLSSIKGVGKQRVRQISDSWKAHHTMRILLTFLRENGVNLSYGAKIFREYGADAIDIMQNNPFRIINDIPGIGFFVADAIVKNSGMPVDERERAKACTLYILKQASDEGHTFLFYRRLLERCGKSFGIDEDTVADAVAGLVDADEIHTVSDEMGGTDDMAIYLKTLYHAEEGTANKLAALLSVPVCEQVPDPEKINR